MSQSLVILPFGSEPIYLTKSHIPELPAESSSSNADTIALCQILRRKTVFHDQLLEDGLGPQCRYIQLEKPS